MGSVARGYGSDVWRSRRVVKEGAPHTGCGRDVHRLAASPRIHDGMLGKGTGPGSLATQRLVNERVRMRDAGIGLAELGMNRSCPERPISEDQCHWESEHATRGSSISQQSFGRKSGGATRSDDMNPTFEWLVRLPPSGMAYFLKAPTP